VAELCQNGLLSTTRRWFGRSSCRDVDGTWTMTLMLLTHRDRQTRMQTDRQTSSNLHPPPVNYRSMRRRRRRRCSNSPAARWLHAAAAAAAAAGMCTARLHAGYCTVYHDWFTPINSCSTDHRAAVPLHHFHAHTPLAVVELLYSMGDAKNLKLESNVWARAHRAIMQLFFVWAKLSCCVHQKNSGGKAPGWKGG